MKILTPGHKYSLDSFEGGVSQELQFIEKVISEDVENSKGVSHLNPVTKNDGTTNEEVLKVLINRLQFLNEKFPCRENALAITKLQEALFWLYLRTELRQQQNVEGKLLNHKS